MLNVANFVCFIFYYYYDFFIVMLIFVLLFFSYKRGEVPFISLVASWPILRHLQYFNDLILCNHVCAKKPTTGLNTV